MGKKVGAFIWIGVTVLLAVIGFSGYSSGDYYMEWFGIRLSAGGFAVLILVFLAIDIFSIANAFKNDKKVDAARQQFMSNYNPQTSEQLAAPCVVNVTRKSKFVGALLGFNIYLNYARVGVLKNGKTITFVTNIKNNVLTGDSNQGPCREPFYFEAIPGGNIFIDFSATKLKFEWSNIR